MVQTSSNFPEQIIAVVQYFVSIAVFSRFMASVAKINSAKISAFKVPPWLCVTKTRVIRNFSYKYSTVCKINFNLALK